MRYLIVATIIAALATGAFAATTPGTIISTCANASYADTTGLAMPQLTSNQTDVLVTSAATAKPLMLSVSSLYSGLTTVGRLVKVVGTVSVDQNGVWLDDGSMIPTGTVDANGNPILKSVKCRLATNFVGQVPAAGKFIAVTGFSQVDSGGIPSIIPSADSGLQTYTP